MARIWKGRSWEKIASHMYWQYAGSTRYAGNQTHSHIVSRSIADAQDVTTCVCILYYHKAIKLSCKSTVLFCNCVTRFFKGLEWDHNDGKRWTRQWRAFGKAFTEITAQLKYLCDDVVHIIIKQLMVFIGIVRFYGLRAGPNKLFGFKFTRIVRVVKKSE